MSLFSTILQKLGFADQGSDAVPPATPDPTPLPGAQAVIATGRSSPMSPDAAIPQVDVMAQLERLAAAHAPDSNWKTSIVDLMKLLGLDSDKSTREALAREPGCPPQTMTSTALMNPWLHKTVLQKLAANGGKVPPELL